MSNWSSALVIGLAVLLILSPVGSSFRTDSTFHNAVQPPEHPHVQTAYVEADEARRFELLLEEFGRHKDLPEGYELQALLALSHYPELKKVKIRFIQDDVNIPISSRPLWSTLFRSAAKRTYLVVIDTEREGSREALLVKHQPFNAQVGIIGHELAHTVYYLDRSFFGIAGDGICQLSDCRINFEQATDRRLIDYGLGWQRLEHSAFIRGGFLAEGNPFDDSGSGPYVGPTKLMEIIGEHPAYADSLEAACLADNTETQNAPAELVAVC
jgi:hypothetical protein